MRAGLGRPRRWYRRWSAPRPQTGRVLRIWGKHFPSFFSAATTSREVFGSRDEPPLGAATAAAVAGRPPASSVNVSRSDVPPPPLTSHHDRRVSAPAAGRCPPPYPVGPQPWRATAGAHDPATHTCAPVPPRRASRSPRRWPHATSGEARWPAPSNTTADATAVELRWRRQRAATAQRPHRRWWQRRPQSTHGGPATGSASLLEERTCGRVPNRLRLTRRNTTQETCGGWRHSKGPELGQWALVER